MSRGNPVRIAAAQLAGIAAAYAQMGRLDEGQALDTWGDGTPVATTPVIGD